MLREGADTQTPWPFGPEVHVVASHGELPGGAPEGTLGAYADGRAYVVATPQPLHAARTAAHEVLGHHAPRQLMGESWRHFCSAVEDGAAVDPKLAPFRNHVRQSYDTNLRRRDVADEVIAACAEHGFSPLRGRFEADKPIRSYLAAIGGQFARRWLCLSIPASYVELEGVILAGEWRMRSGGTRVGNLLWGGYAPPMTSKPMGPRRPARNLEESQAMYDAERNREVGREENKALLQLAGGGVLILGGLVALIAFLWSLF